MATKNSDREARSEPVSREWAAKILREDNPKAAEVSIQLYASVFADYWEAEDNISRNGNVAAHPRTGAPMVNPYCSTKAQAVKSLGTMVKSVRLSTDRLWAEAARTAPERVKVSTGLRM